MASFLFQLGSTDLAQYVRVNPGENFSPYGDGTFQTPGFVQTPFADGDALSSVDNANREIHAPMHLKAATKDALHTLVQTINTELSKTNAPGGLQLQWKDESATNTTFFDVQFGRLEVEYDFRRSQHAYGDATLHLWVSPFGSSGTTRITATGVGTGGVFTVSVPSIAGDVPPLLDVRLSEGSYFTAQGRILGVAAIPHASYAVKTPVSSYLNLSGASVFGASGAEGSQVVGVAAIATVSWPFSFAAALGNASVYAGRAHRLLIPARTVNLGAPGVGSSVGVSAVQALTGGRALGPTAVATSADWSLLDLGVLRVPSAVGATVVIQMQGRHSRTLTPPFMDGPPAMGATYTTQYGALIMVPDDNTSILTDSPRLPVAIDLLPVSGSVADLRSRQDAFGNQWASSALPAAAGVYGQAAGDYGGNLLAPNLAAASWMARAIVQHTPQADLTIEAIGGLLSTAGSAAGYGVLKELSGIGSQCAIEGLYHQAALGSSWLELNLINNGATTLLGSAALPAGASAMGPAGFGRVKLVTQGPAVSFVLDPVDSNALGVAGASIVSSHALAAAAGQGGIAARASQAAGGEPRFRAVRITALPSQAQAASDMYEVDQVGQSVTRTSGANVDGISERVRGRVRATPSTVAIAALSASVDKGSMNDLLAVDIRVRERFSYAR